MGRGARQDRVTSIESDSAPISSKALLVTWYTVDDPRCDCFHHSDVRDEYNCSAGDVLAACPVVTPLFARLATSVFAA